MHSMLLLFVKNQEKKKRIASCILTVSMDESEFGFIGETLNK